MLGFNASNGFYLCAMLKVLTIISLVMLWLIHFRNLSHNKELSAGEKQQVCEHKQKTCTGMGSGNETL